MGHARYPSTAAAFIRIYDDKTLGGGGGGGGAVNTEYDNLKKVHTFTAQHFSTFKRYISKHRTFFDPLTLFFVTF